MHLQGALQYEKLEPTVPLALLLYKTVITHCFRELESFCSIASCFFLTVCHFRGVKTFILWCVCNGEAEFVPLLRNVLDCAHLSGGSLHK